MDVKPAAAPAAPPLPPDQLGATPAPAAPEPAPLRPAFQPPTARDAGLPFSALPMPLLDLSGLLSGGAAPAGPLPGSGDPFAGAVREPAPARSPEVQQHVADQLAAWPEGSPERAQLQRAFASPAFAALRPEEQQKLASYVSGHNPISTSGRQQLLQLLDQPNAGAGQLRNLLDTEPGAPQVVAGLPSIAEPARLPYTIHGPTQVTNTFASGAAQANRYDVEIAGQTIPVYLSQAVEPKDGVMHSLEEVVKGLAALPDSSRRLIQQVNMDGKRNPSDAYWEQVYHSPGFRSYMTAGASGVVDIYPTVYQQTQHACDASLIHETGHILSGRTWGNWQSDARWQGWDAAISQDGLAPSSYARSSRTEDFSESLTLYQLSKGTPYEAEYRAMFPQRWAALDAVLAAPAPTQ